MAEAQASSKGSSSNSGAIVSTSKNPSSQNMADANRPPNDESLSLPAGVVDPGNDDSSANYSRWAASAAPPHQTSSVGSANHSWNNGGFGVAPRGPWGVVPPKSNASGPVAPPCGTWGTSGQRHQGAEGAPRSLGPPNSAGTGVGDVGVRALDGSIVEKTQIAK